MAHAAVCPTVILTDMANFTAYFHRRKCFVHLQIPAVTIYLTVSISSASVPLLSGHP